MSSFRFLRECSLLKTLRPFTIIPKPTTICLNRQFSYIKSHQSWTSQTSSISIKPFTRQYSVTTDGKEVPNEVDELSIDQYHKISNEYLEEFVDQLEAFAETYREMDLDYADGVLNMELPPFGKYCINKQPPNKQIWSSSPISGPNRYDLVNGKWISLRDGSSLTEIMEQEIKEASGNKDFKFELDL